MRFPPKTLHLSPGEFVDLKEAEGRHVLEYCGASGVVEVQAGESDADAMQRAKRARMDMVLWQLKSYREEQNRRSRTGLEVILPRAEHRAWLAEYRQLRKELGDDEVLTAHDIPGLATPKELLADPVAEELQVFGIPPQSSQPTQGGDILSGL